MKSLTFNRVLKIAISWFITVLAEEEAVLVLTTKYYNIHLDTFLIHGSLFFFNLLALGVNNVKSFNLQNSKDFQLVFSGAEIEERDESKVQRTQ
ncbi:unnamed protein product (macronuclear) [Paramecium tetraurelia]|uniref:Uncharacterized protein n=1 Tax=Paramecium tetraurelia TaxID=5888 RepID=A0E000_PARTE|nr:uncharacterized protein GSPATT00021785001 [Paramecium tetraurelia]CAK88617.1 unnamed protein product [Paramecium tetraurelia]|eukprot:XP_001456014.1 hypothetical protein (macronuclear) [Paramecium tetraurelia strain d4-2]